jgi:Ca-activated chloride channel family protein
VSFLHPQVLALLVPLAAWAAWEWRKTNRHGALALKAGVLGAVLAALADPKLPVFERRVALALLADTSLSIPADDLKTETDLIGRIRAARGRHSLQVIPFSDETRALKPEEGGSQIELRAEGHATNLEAAVRSGIAALPEGRVPRVMLISDGQENAGSIERAIYQARLLGVPIDTYALPGRKRPDLRLESVSLPPQAFTGEKFDIEAVVSSPRPASATVEVTAEKKPIGRAEVKLVEGKNTLRVRTQLDAVGATPVAGVIRSAELGEVRFDRVVSLRRPRLLLVSPEPHDSLRALRQVLHAARFDVADWPGGAPLPRILRDYQVVLAINEDLESWPADQKARLEAYVREGGGFALIAGENNVYAQHKQDEDPLEKMLPATLAPPRTPEGTAVVLIIDKSSSMEGKKMELARLSAIGVVENLRPIDLVGVLIFDNSFQWAVPIRKADNLPLLKRLISGITPDGGTQIAPALNEAYRQIKRVKAVYRHIVLLTDGISEEGDSMALAKEAASNQVTISTVGLGQDVNRVYLEKVANLAKGKSYFLLEFGNLEQLLLRDVMEHTGSSAVEKPVHVAVLRDAEILDGVGITKAPPLQGYLKFVSKPQAETILQADGKDPLLARWQYGLGRSVVFASDAKPRWAANWIGWPGYDRLWTNLVRDLLPRAPETEATAEFDSANNEIVVRYRFQPGVDLPEPLPDLYALGPNGFKKAVPLRRTAPSSYQGRVPIETNQGLFRIRPADDLAKLPEVGIYREEEELTQYGSNAELLRQTAEATGGRFNPTPRQAFDAGGRAVTTTMDLWPGFLALAIFLNLAELAARKGYQIKRLWTPRRWGAGGAPT